MSQAITKLQEGGAAEKPSKKTYDYLGKLIDQDQFIRDALQGASKFAYEESGVINRKKQDQVYDQILNLVELAKKGDLDRVVKGFQTTADVHNTDKRRDPVGLAAYYIDQVMQKAPEYKEEKKPEEKKDDADKLPLFTKQKTGQEIFSDLGYTASDFANYDNNQKIQALTNVLNQLKQNGSNYDFTGSLFNDAAGYEQALNQAIESLNDNELSLTDNPYFRRLGFDDSILTSPTVQSQDKEEPEKELTDKEKELTELYINPLNGRTMPSPVYLGDDFYNIDNNQERWNDISGENARNYINNYFIPYFNQYNPITSQDESSFEDQLNLFTPLTRVLGKVKRPGLSLNKNQYISYMLNSIKDELIPNESTGEYILPFSFNDKDGDENKGTIMLWDPVTNKLRMDAAANTDYWEIIKANYDEKHPQPLNVGYHKEGGSLKLQYGGTYTYNAKNKFANEDRKVKEEMAKSGRTEKQVKKGQQPLQDGKLETTDILRISSTAGDIFSMISAWVPGWGTIASAISGGASSINTAIAEGMEGNMNGWQIAKQLGGNLALDLVGLIPYFGSAAKTGKIAKNVIKYIPSIFALANSGKILLDEDTRASLTKINNGKKDLTLDDWKRIASALSAVAGLSRVGASHMKMNQMKKAATPVTTTTPAKGKIRLKDGRELDVTPEQYTQLQSALKNKEFTKVDELVKSIGGEGAALKQIPHIDRSRGLFGLKETQKATTTTTYDTSTLPSKFGDSNKWWTDAGIFRRYYGAPSANPNPNVEQPTVRGQLQYWRNLPDGSRVYLQKRGGMILFAKDGVQALWRKDPNYSDSQAGNTGLWDEWYNITDDDIIKYLNSADLTQANIDALNGVTTDNFGNKVYNKRGYQSWNENYNNTGLNEFFGYSDKVNDYLGPSTWNRYKVFERLKELTQNGPVNTNNGTLSIVDGKFIFDPKANIPDKLLEQGPRTNPENLNQNSIGLQTPQENIFDKTKKFRERYVQEVPGLMRLVGTLHTNRVAANKAADSIRPPMRDAINLQRQIRGDYATQYAYENQGNRIYQAAKQGQTSDAELNNRTMLTAADQAAEKKLQGDLLYNQMFRDSVEKAWQAEAQNKQERNQVAWDNLVRFRDAMKAKSDIQNARYLSNWKSIHDFIAEKEYLRKSKEQALNQLAFQKETNQLLNEMTWDPDQIKLNNLMSQEVISDADQQEINRLRKVLSERYDERPFELRRKYLYAKRGTKITVKKDRTHSDRTFHKAIKDTRDAHLKLLDNLSAVTKHLILKAMT